MRALQKNIGFLSVALALSLLASSASFAAKKELPEVSPEGLKLIKGTKLYAVYMRDGADFSGYDKVIILDSYVAFKKNWQREQNFSSLQRVSDADITRIKAKLAKEFKAVFTKELTAKGQTVVTEDGSDVLILRPAIINLDITAPDTRSPGMSHTISASAGQMTLYLEIYDSVTSDLLARVVDPEADRGMGTFSISDSVSNKVAADRILKSWANILGEYLQKAREGAAK